MFDSASYIELTCAPFVWQFTSTHRGNQIAISLTRQPTHKGHTFWQMQEGREAPRLPGGAPIAAAAAGNTAPTNQQATQPTLLQRIVAMLTSGAARCPVRSCGLPIVSTIPTTPRGRSSLKDKNEQQIVRAKCQNGHSLTPCPRCGQLFSGHSVLVQHFEKEHPAGKGKEVSSASSSSSMAAVHPVSSQVSRNGAVAREQLLRELDNMAAEVMNVWIARGVQQNRSDDHGQHKKTSLVRSTQETVENVQKRARVESVALDTSRHAVSATRPCHTAIINSDKSVVRIDCCPL